MRDGIYKTNKYDVNLNEALLNPYLLEIMPRWHMVAKSEPFKHFRLQTARVIKALLVDLEASAAGTAMQDVVEGQKKTVTKWTRATFKRMAEDGEKVLERTRRATSLTVASEVVQNRLQEAYAHALTLNGKGSLKARKVSVKDSN